MMASAGPASDYTVEWYTNPNLTGSPVYSGNSYTLNPAVASAEYYVVAKNRITGCPSSPSAAQTVTLTIIPTPGMPVIQPVELTEICEGNTVELTATLAGATPASTYVWYKDGVEISTGAVANYTADQSGSYTVVAIANTGCSSEESEMKEVEVIPYPEIPILSAGPIITVARMQPMPTVTILNVESDVTYQWFQNEIPLAGEIAPRLIIHSMTLRDVGIYIVQASRGECWVESDKFQLRMGDDIYIPNTLTPNGDGVNDVFYIGIDFSNYRLAELVIVNRWGNEVYRNSNYQNCQNGTDADHCFTGAGLENGTYFYRFRLVGNDDVTTTHAGYITLIHE
jgi:gliding motility-associated-like protein